MPDLTPKQWELIKQGRMSQKRMEKLLLNMTGATKEKVLYNMKAMVQNEEEIKEAIRKAHPHQSYYRRVEVDYYSLTSSYC